MSTVPPEAQHQPTASEPLQPSDHQPKPPTMIPIQPQADPDVHQANCVSKSSAIFLAIVVSLITSTASVWAYDHYFAQKVVAVDIKTFIEEKKTDFIAGRLDEAGMKREMDKLEATVAAIPKNKAVLLGDLVVKNVQIIKP